MGPIDKIKFKDIYDSLSVLLLHILQILHNMQTCLAERIGNCWYPQEFDMESSIYTGCIYDFGSEGRGFVEKGGTIERGLNKAFTVNYSFEGHFG